MSAGIRNERKFVALLANLANDRRFYGKMSVLVGGVR